MNIIANYLPQFYETETNNIHYGKGYTEWVAVSKAEKYFEGHNQPRLPLRENYYSLLEVETLRQQSRLAREFGIDGFAFYHYFFGSGRLELEKPAELFLKNRDIHIKFFLIWANESWGRSGNSKTGVNRWTNKFDTGEGQDLFLEQKYEGIEQYKNHYHYVRQFIKDSRYVKIHGRFAFAVYNTSHTKELQLMMRKWNDWAREDGYAGFYFIGVNAWNHEELFDAVLYQAPNAAYHYGVPTLEHRNGVAVKNYFDVMDKILNIEDKESAFYGTFVDFDNSPRYGNTHSLMMDNSAPESFENYIRKIMKKNEKNGSGFLFINAWNEWGEGNYLEPDTVHEYRYLEVIKRAKRAAHCDVSIIIPAYNVEEYLEECLDSILIQKGLTYEILCINDGSTDQTEKIIRKYQRRYPDLITAYTTEHRGVSAARNAGIEMALGRHVYYVDADDYLEPSAFQKMYEVIQQYKNFDMCFFSFKNVCNHQELRKKYEKMISKKKRSREIQDAVRGGEAFSEMWDHGEYYPLVWLQLVKRDFLESTGIAFKPNIEYEDQLYTFQLLMRAESVLCFDYEIYNKRIRYNSICTSEKAGKYVMSYLTVFKEISDEIPIDRRTPQISSLLESFMERVRKVFRELPENEKQSIYETMDFEPGGYLNNIL